MCLPRVDVDGSRCGCPCGGCSPGACVGRGGWAGRGPARVASGLDGWLGPSAAAAGLALQGLCWPQRQALLQHVAVLVGVAGEWQCWEGCPRCPAAAASDAGLLSVWSRMPAA